MGFHVGPMFILGFIVAKLVAKTELTLQEAQVN